MMRDEDPALVREHARLSTCQGKEPLLPAVAKKLSVKHNKRGRNTSAYKCRFCAGWHIGSGRTKPEPYR